MGIEAIAALLGLVVPPAFDFIKKKFIRSENDTPERTIGTLATTSPDVLPAYTEASAKLFEARTKWFNRDIVGNPSPWLVNLRGAIRPVSVILSFAVLGLSMTIPEFTLDEGTKAALFVNIGSWFGDRL
jgi:hypothetical protein